MVQMISSSFAKNLWHITWNEAHRQPLPPPGAPFKPAWWTNTNFVAQPASADLVQALANATKRGLPLTDVFTHPTLVALRVRLDAFPDGKFPPDTLLMLDFEGAELDYAKLLCSNTARVTSSYVQYPPAYWYNNPDYSLEGYATLAEIALFCQMRMWSHSKPITDLSGDYLLVQMYIGDARVVNQEQATSSDCDFRTFLLAIASHRAVFPEKKILAIVTGRLIGGGGTPTDLMGDALRHRLCRFVQATCDGVIVWGPRDDCKDLLADFATLAGDPLHRFAGQEGWAP
jgi:hypothetical protein